MTEKSLKLSMRRRFSSCLQNQFFTLKRIIVKFVLIELKTNNSFLINKAGFDTGSELKLHFLEK